ncbi:hypothetical protein PR048_000671 [Dryococelus australis]|uniref:Uncharacterized protein n=1 Tax=Dryococelus australis TaxID=614101 RepID=A0ABQ9IFA0_9NEOP|nr:hypothetical protein PR048_000671 [Dryococelus australis]
MRLEVYCKIVGVNVIRTVVVIQITLVVNTVMPKRKKSNPASWKRSISKLKRNNAEEYIGKGGKEIAKEKKKGMPLCGCVSRCMLCLGQETCDGINTAF